MADKRLFTIKDNTSGKTLGSFSDKRLAKIQRDEWNGPVPEDFILGTKRRFSVAYGPDHPKFS